MSLRWQKEGDDHILVSSVPVLGRRGPRIGAEGVESGLLWRKTWPWADIAAVSWDQDTEGLACLAVCIRRDPWVKVVPVGTWAWNFSWDDCRGLLEEIRPVVEQMGARLENRDEAATHWWHLDPEARRF